MSVQTTKRQPWANIWANNAAAEPLRAESQGLKYNFEKGERMVIDGSAQRGRANGASGGQWMVEAESSAPSEEDKTDR